MGIGTQAPSAALQILKPLGNSGLSTSKSNANYQLVVSGDGSTGDTAGIGFQMNATEGTQNAVGAAIVGIDTGASNGGALAFLTSETGVGTILERMRISDSGNLGIGTTTPWGKLSVTNTGSGPSFVVEDSTSPDTTPFIIDASGNVGIGTASPTGGMKLDVVGNEYVQGDLYAQRFLDQQNGTYYIDPNNTSISALFAGNVGIGTTTPGTLLSVAGLSAFGNIRSTQISGSAAWMSITYTAASHRGIALNDTSQTSGAESISFMSGGTQVGKIQTTSSATSYITSSDLRLKENIVDTALGLDALSLIKVREFNFIGSTTTTQGFIAQELYDIYPHAVAVGGESSTSSPWGVDYGRLTPLIVSAIQELDLKVESIASSTLALSEAEGFASRFFSTLKERLVAWFADATNGIDELYARIIHANELMFVRAEGDEITVKKLCIEDVCVTRDQLAALLASAAASGSSPPPPLEDPEPVEGPPPPPSAQDVATTTPPTDDTATSTPPADLPAEESAQAGDSPTEEPSPVEETPEEEEPPPSPSDSAEATTDKETTDGQGAPEEETPSQEPAPESEPQRPSLPQATEGQGASAESNPNS
ncbi:hypothetical protein COU18_03850 [Candidatus Kaiserbacteria bacterium CG10_big_fil_rev_8_21_14_0_10_51_14]|uniref:Peptidase S74 domain-containing protein n=1 Tax=Candidatus Kaiserbacteria bacterium CG10_big_fil_rev_8_21_14_0_10_51_14 TaxID=1974610 RepID=A0A2H0UCM6_9BACT|nr:MAG: hypothetical protein COU18_03850 [Candidatus Kaiserbacteria bacterium CG10_big_fil_rev_8_21_14_0_10_51_14]